MRFAYADPPYIGQARKHYSHDVNCAEVDHGALFRRLVEYDGWALSLSSPSLEEIMHLARVNVGKDVVRVGGWFKPFAVFKPNVNPGYTWEPVIFYPGPRKRTRAEPTTRDWVEAEDPDCIKANITLKKGLAGAKPEPFCRWLPDLMGMTPDDTLDDLYPGTGVVTATFEMWKRERAA